MPESDALPTSHLFVYGTLRAAVSHPLANLLAENGRHLGEATCPGALYDVGRYPALVPAEEEADRVHGEAWLLDPTRADMVLTTLDHYEGCPDGAEEPALYVRKVLPVTLAGGEVVEAWVWVYNRTVEGLRRIVSGDWLKRSDPE
jgi:gamma-glutamylcyclotransferase (GGCT)/AIG2-like uncharacterized protein YtfP